MYFQKLISKTSWRLMVTDENSRIRIESEVVYGSTDLRIRIRTKMPRIRNTDESCERNSPRKAKADVSGF
jgi:hypothetical protein